MSPVTEVIGEGHAGHDKFGSFTLTQNYCGVCGTPGIVLRYKPGLELPTYYGSDGSSGPLDPGRLVIKSARTHIGVTCGCYASFHRQVASIVANNKTARGR